jgi:putative ABC transport system permease protein
MTFKGIVWKNFKYGIQKYVAFFLCSTFTIAIFFIFLNLTFSKEIDAFMNYAGMGAQFVFPIMVIIISIFAIGFISYISSSKNKSRSKEFGLYMTMGMSKRDISKLVIIEDILLGSVSIVTGIVIGMIFSRLVYMITVNMIAAEGMDFALDYRSVLLTGIVFIVIYIFNIILTMASRRKMKIKDLITVDRKSEFTKKSFISLTILGLAMMLMFAGVAIAAAKSRDIAMNENLIVVAIVIGIAGAYLVISNIIGIISSIAKKDKGLYAKNLISLSELKYTSNKNAKVLFILSLLSGMILLCSASTIALLNICEEIVDTQNAVNISYVDAFGVNSFKPGLVEDLIKESGAILKEHKTFKCSFAYNVTETGDKGIPICIIDATTVSLMNGKLESVKDDEAKILAVDPLQKPVESQLAEMNITYSSFIKKLKIAETIINNKFSSEMVLGNRYMLVVSDKTYADIASVSGGYNGNIHSINVENWRKTGGVFDRLSQIRDSSKPLSEHFTLAGSYVGYRLMKRLYSTFVFITNFISILFFAASILILLFRQYENVDKMAQKYSQLRKIGMTKGEFKRFIGTQSRFVFIVPLIFGLFIGACMQLIMQSIVGGNDFYAVFWKVSSKVAVVYIVLQMIFCKVVTNAYFKRIISIAGVK